MSFHAPSTINDTTVGDPQFQDMLKLVLAVSQLPRQAAPEPPVVEIMPADFQPTGPLNKEVTFRDYTLRIYEGTNDLESSFAIYQGGKCLYAKEGHLFIVNETFGESDQEKAIPMGMEITGEGQPNLVILEYTGGAHCCLKYHVFEIGKRFRAIAVIYAADSPALFKDLDNDGKLEVELNDWTYAYQFTCFAGSPSERVVLRYKDDGYFVAPDLMYMPAPTEAELQEKAREVKAVYEKEKANPGEWGAPANIWAKMLDLIYTGHENLAYRFYDRAWPTGVAGKETALTKFREVLLGSPYYREMKRIVVK